MLKIIYLSFLFFVFISMLVLWYRNKRLTRTFHYAGLYIAGVVLTLQLIAVYHSKHLIEMQILVGAFVSLPLTAIEFYAYTVVGLVFAFKLQKRSVISLAYKPHRGHLSLGDIFPIRFTKLMVTLTLTLFLVIFSVLLIRFSGAEIAEAFTNLMNDQIPVDNVTGSAQENSLNRILYAVVIAAIIEEIIFRLCLQNWLCVLLRKKAYSEWISILTATSIWMVAHVGMLEPEWVKMLQVFVIGIVLGVINLRFGIQYCIILHVLFNLIMVPFGNRLLT